MSAFTDFCDSIEPRAAVYLLEVNIYSAGLPRGGLLPIWNRVPWNTLPFGSPYIAGETTKRLASRGGYTTHASDTPAVENYLGLLEGLPTMNRQLPLSPLSSRMLASSVGRISLANRGGDLTSSFNAGGIDGRDVVLRVGDPAWPLSDFGIVMAGAGVAWWEESAGAFLELRDRTYRLARTLQNETYAGTGGYEGGADLAGQCRPLCFGLRRNVLGVAVDRPNGIYQFHVRQIQAFDKVLVRAAEITFDTNDYPTYAALLAASVTPGYYATCKSLGLIKLGAQADGQVTADLRGDAQGGYVATAAGIVQRLIEDFTDSQAGDIDTTAFSDFAAAEPATIGWCRGTEKINADEAITEIVNGVQGYWGGSRAGKYTIGALRAPSALDADFDLTEGVEITSLVKLPPSSEVETPPYRVQIGYAQSNTVQPGDGLSGSAIAAQLDFIKQEFRYAVAGNPVIQAKYRNAQDWKLPGLYAEYADALAKATALFNEFSPGVPLYKGAMACRRAWRLDLGMGGRLTSGPRGLVSAPARIVGINEFPGQNQAIVTFWVAP
ncbi:MAG: hypothetical protein KBC46_03505 [Ferrovibrio sp.]|nr:hypothetical protein [Ferrovibrio sp.]